ncbi:Basic endochitinase C [Acorus gramineus]|uniref:chitinase n=1 Tax=Acorus gramineus TaxID=55184 RepID=A0AAV9B8D3_ACOGR|nr:Basic endochitinase C [Acorus gramineus]
MSNIIYKIDKLKQLCDGNYLLTLTHDGLNHHSNYNYGPAGKAIDADLLGNPDLVATDPAISFKTVIWFWMTHPTIS